jgi:hypothetical protein
MEENESMRLGWSSNRTSASKGRRLMCNKVTRVKVVDDFERHGDDDEEREQRRGGSSTATREKFRFSMLSSRGCCARTGRCSDVEQGVSSQVGTAQGDGGDVDQRNAELLVAGW